VEVVDFNESFARHAHPHLNMGKRNPRDGNRKPTRAVNLDRPLYGSASRRGACLEVSADVEFIIVSTAVGASVLLALSGTRVVLWVLMLCIMRDAAANPAAEN
jgi:hypothetical protein